MITTEVAALAKKLTFIEQCFVCDGKVRMAWPFEVEARDRLVQRGLVRKRWFGYRLTPLGLAVRNHLLASGGTMATGQRSCSEIADQAQPHD